MQSFSVSRALYQTAQKRKQSKVTLGNKCKFVQNSPFTGWWIMITLNRMTTPALKFQSLHAQKGLSSIRFIITARACITLLHHPKCLLQWTLYHATSMSNKLILPQLLRWSWILGRPKFFGQKNSQTPQGSFGQNVSSHQFYSSFDIAWPRNLR